MAGTVKITLSDTKATQIFTSAEEGVATVLGEAYFFMSDEATPAIPTDGAAHYRAAGSIIKSNKQNIFAYSKKGSAFLADVVVSKWN